MIASNRFLFVYGTLRAESRHRMHEELAMRARFVGRGYTNAELFDLGEYPGIVVPPVNNSQRTLGELYELDSENLAESWIALDEYEGCGLRDPQPHQYSRRNVPVHLGDGRTVEAWTYALTRLPEWATPIPGGDYLARSRSKADGAALA
jgi:gamma-glutamylcyclotransferase (GGCT)/AIG2-like uncharacterized protein YtfP